MIPCIGHILKLEKKQRTVTNADPVPEEVPEVSSKVLPETVKETFNSRREDG